MVDQDTLEPIKVVTTLERFPVPHLMLTDGEQTGLVTDGRDDTFTIKFFSPSTSPMVHTNQLPVKLAGNVLNLWIQAL